MKYKIFCILFLIIAHSFAQNKNQSIGFKENKGQIIDQKGTPNPTVKYLLNTRGLNVQLKNNGFSYDIYETKKHPFPESQKEKLHPSPPSENDKEKVPDYSLEYIYHRIDIDFVNSNPKVELIPKEKSKDYDNYYNVPNKPDGVLMVHQYQQITYKNIYPNIDVVFSIPQDSLKAVEYNFVIHPSGKISDIQLKFNGAETDLVNNKIQMQVRFGKMEETLPMSWTENGKDKKEITVGYTKIKDNIYGFESRENVSNKTVIIDPVPVRLWGTYYGGYSTEYSQKIKTDKLGNVVIIGETNSNNNIATSGSFQTIKTALWETSFIGKLTPNGNRIWGTYINSARIVDLAINSTNEIYVGGSDRGYGSADYLTTTGAHKNTNPDFNLDGLILKFNSNGQQIWGTLYGGINRDWINTISLDSQENLIIAGVTHSIDGITTSNAFQSNNNDPFDGCGFFAKFTPSGTRILGSYFPGKIDCSSTDKDNNLVFAGQYWILDTDQPDISTPGAHQTQIHYMDGFIVKFNSIGQRMWCTYYGGDASFYISVNGYYDRITSIGTDSLNNIYITGITNSINNIATIGAHKENQRTNGVDSFLAKLNSNGTRLWGTYYGSDYSLQNNDYCESGFVSPDGNIYITGNTRSDIDIATPGSFQPTTNGSDEGFISKFNTNGILVWGTYYGGSFQDYIKNIFYNNGQIYTIGLTSGSNNLGTSSTESPTLSGGNLFIAKFQDCVSITIASSNSPICIGNTLELKASGGTNYSWTGPNSFASALQNPTIPNATAVNSGQYSCAISGTGGCDDTKTVDVIVGDFQAPTPNLVTLPTVTGDCHTVITTIPTATDACAGAITATTTNPLLYSLPGTYTIVWNYNDGNGNTSNQNQIVSISNQPLPTATSPQNFCIQQNATLSSIAITGQNIKWFDDLTNGNFLANTTLLQNGTTYYASQTINGCESERIPILINIQNTATPTGNSPQTFCASQNPTLNTLVITGTAVKWYDSLTLGNLLPISTPLLNGQTYYATQTLNGCESPTRLAITVTLISTLPANNYEELFCDDLNDGSETVNLSSYNSSIISNDTNYNFSYYTSLSGAQNETAANKIANFTSYKLVLGDNKIYVRINSNTPCYAISEIKLTLFSKPIINIQDIVSICENNTITIDAGAGFDNYTWSNGATTQTITVDNPGNFSVTVTNDYDTISCSSTKKFTVKKSNKATINTIETKDWTDSDNVITVFATGNGDYQYSIDSVNYQESNQFTGLISGKYTVLVRDKNGCGTATDEVYLLMFPRYFTPNGDGYNDTWKIKFSDIEAGLTVKIFDRYGKIIKVLDTNTDSWDGTYNGTDLPATDYWFVVTRANGIKYKGHFSLKR